MLNCWRINRPAWIVLSPGGAADGSQGEASLRAQPLEGEGALNSEADASMLLAVTYVSPCRGIGWPGLSHPEIGAKHEFKAPVVGPYQPGLCLVV